MPTEPPRPTAENTGILPGKGWPADLLDPESDESGAFFLEHTYDQNLEVPGARTILDQTRTEWQHLFPDTGEREARMFQAGAIALAYWIRAQSTHYQNLGLALISFEAMDELVEFHLDRLVSVVQCVLDDLEACPPVSLPEVP